MVSLFSLGWFVVGVFIGRHLYYSREKGGRAAGRSSAGEFEIYVGNLPYEIGERDLESMFGKYGRVTGARIITNKFNGKSRGYGFVEMSDIGELRTAVRALNGKEIKGRRIVVNEARSAPRD